MSEKDEDSYKVELYIYDLTKGLAKQMSPALLGKEIEGIWHSGIVAYGREYFFGAGGVESVSPGGTILGEPSRIEELGNTQVPYNLFLEYIFGLGESAFKPGAYDLLKHNCNNFSEEVSQFLCGRGIPKYILTLPDEVLNTELGKILSTLAKALKLKEGYTRSIPLGGAVSVDYLPREIPRQRSDPELAELNSAIDEVRQNTQILEQNRNTLNEKLLKKEKKKLKQEKKEKKKKQRHNSEAGSSQDENNSPNSPTENLPRKRRESVHFASEPILISIQPPRRRLSVPCGDSETKLLRPIKPILRNAQYNNSISSNSYTLNFNCSASVSNDDSNARINEVESPNQAFERLNRQETKNIHPEPQSCSSNNIPSLLSETQNKRQETANRRAKITNQQLGKENQLSEKQSQQLETQNQQLTLNQQETETQSQQPKTNNEQQKTETQNQHRLKTENNQLETQNMEEENRLLPQESANNNETNTFIRENGVEISPENDTPTIEIEREPPIVFKGNVDPITDFDGFVLCVAQMLTEEEQKHMEELRAYVVEDEGSWSLGEDFNKLFMRVFCDPAIPVEGQRHIIRIMASAALKDDVILMLHQDRKEHTIMNYANKIESLAPEIQEALALFFCNMFEHLSPSEWLLYISEWTESSQQISNIRVTTKVAVNALLHTNPKVVEYGTALMYNLGTKEVKSVVFDDVAPELAMAILQYVANNPQEEFLWRALYALGKFCYASSEVPMLIKMIGPNPNTFKGVSSRIDESLEYINVKLSRVPKF